MNEIKQMNYSNIKKQEFKKQFIQTFEFSFFLYFATIYIFVLIEVKMEKVFVKIKSTYLSSQHILDTSPFGLSYLFSS